MRLKVRIKQLFVNVTILGVLFILNIAMYALFSNHIFDIGNIRELNSSIQSAKGNTIFSTDYEDTKLPLEQLMASLGLTKERLTTKGVKRIPKEYFRKMMSDRTLTHKSSRALKQTRKRNEGSIFTQDQFSSKPNPILTQNIPVHHTNNIYRTSRIISPEVAEKTSAYDVSMSPKERHILQDILLKCKSVLEKNGIKFFMYSGTLLGSYRQHDIIPWDDDVDIIVSIKDMNALLKTLAKLHPYFFLDTYSPVRWKFFSIQSRPVKVLPWSWPFLDISFYKENSTHIWDSDKMFSKYYTYLKTDIFPLTRRPLMGILLPAPKNTSAVLKFYKPDICRSLSYSHREEHRILHAYKTDCENLKNRYPFVKRQRLANGINETLVKGGKVLKWFFTRNE